MKDFLGQEIHVGDTVVYPNRHGSRLWMNLAVVTDVLMDSLRVRRTEDNTLKPLTRVDRVVVVTKQIEGRVLADKFGVVRTEE